jgi:hypothetical protein
MWCCSEQFSLWTFTERTQLNTAQLVNIPVCVNLEMAVYAWCAGNMVWHKKVTFSSNPADFHTPQHNTAQSCMCELALGCSCSSGLTCRVLSEFGSSGLHHPAEAVRKVAERILTLVYRVNPRLVRKQLPPDDDITRRNLLYRQLFHEFDRIDIQVCVISGFCQKVDEKSLLWVIMQQVVVISYQCFGKTY